MEADFIGKKYITGRTEPINFIGFSFKKEPRLRYFRRIEGQTAANFLLKNKVYPVFAVPRKPFSQASIEGNNSVFSRKFWSRISFSSLEEIDEKLEWFNEASLRYTGYQSCTYEKESAFIPRVYFIRQVQEDQATKDGYIDVLNEKVQLPSSYINYFVLAEWDVTNESLAVHFEKDEALETIERVAFLVNTKSRIRYKGW